MEQIDILVMAKLTSQQIYLFLRVQLVLVDQRDLQANLVKM